MRLFKKDETGRLIYAKLRRRHPGTFNPSVEERRARKRHDWRKDAAAWIVTEEGWSEPFPVRTCQLSAGGCTLLLEREVDASCFLDIEVEGAPEADMLPYAEIMHVEPRGNVWMARCVWVEEVSNKVLRVLLDRPKKTRPKEVLPTRGRESWLTRLWMWFHAA